MMPQDDPAESEQITLRQLASTLGLTPENIRALEKRGRLPEGCEPTIDEMTGTRYWTRAQADRLKQWNDERKPPQHGSGDQPA